jgi:hypothetical protein
VLTEVVIPSDPRRRGMWLRSARQRPGMFILHPAGVGSTLCCNKPGDGLHRSNSIYFIVTTQGVTQRCFSAKTGIDAQLVYGVPCRLLRAPIVALPQELRAALFPIETICATRSMCPVSSAWSLPWPTSVELNPDDDPCHDSPGRPNRGDCQLDEPSDSPAAPPTAPPARRAQPVKRALCDRPPSCKHARTPADPLGFRSEMRYAYAQMSAAIGAALTRGPAAKRTRLQKVPAR